MAYFSDPVRALCLKATLAELQDLRSGYRHVIPPRDLRFLDNLIQGKLERLTAIDQTPDEPTS